MASKLLFYPDKRLLTKCRQLDFKTFNLELIKNILAEMKKEIVTIKGFYENNCIGLSANQIGYDLSLFVISKYPKSENLKNKFFDVLINPEIIEASEKKVYKWEGCISDKEHLLLIKRPEEIKIKFCDLKGNIQIQTLSPIKSRIAQHEIDHLKGLDLYKHDILQKMRIDELMDDEELLDNFITINNEREYLL